MFIFAFLIVLVIDCVDYGYPTLATLRLGDFNSQNSAASHEFWQLKSTSLNIAKLDIPGVDHNKLRTSLKSMSTRPLHLLIEERV